MFKKVYFYTLSLLFCWGSFWISSPLQADSSVCSEELADVVIMLDRSSSIDRTTELPYEAEAAKTLLDTFETLGLGNKVAVAAFSSTATILAGGNLTTDYDALKTVIDTELDIATSGTNIEDAVQVSETELNTGSNPLKVIVLISDGQASRRNTTSLTNSEAAYQAALTAKNNGIRIITIAYDSSDGTTAAITGRQLLASMASAGSVDDTSGSIDSTERDLENSDGDDFYVAPSVDDLNSIFENISDSISCDDNDTCTLDVCNETTRACSFSDIDYDGDGTPDCRDNCPNDFSKTEPGQCGCNALDTDSDGDGSADCNDGCVSDDNKIIPGICGCNVSDADSDGDGMADCDDACDQDSLKTIPGQCGCDVADTDSDLDGSADCLDQCDNDPAKSEPGVCGCDVADTDSDSDGTLNCNDQCPSDPGKIIPGTCGCGTADNDLDSDGTFDCEDSCPEDSSKTLPGQCGCGVEDTDRDSDGTSDCNDLCVSDALKTSPGICDCGVSDTDSDGDGTADCNDSCANDPLKTDPGVCGCGALDTDSDGDGEAICVDNCPNDANKTEPGLCGCGTDDTDSDGDGVANCSDQCPTDPEASQLEDCSGDIVPEISEEPTPEVAAEPIVDPSAGGAVCDIAVDANADGLPDDLDPALDDTDGDGTPDCCTSGNADDDFLAFDSDGDGLPDCREYFFGTNPTVNDITFQGSATNLSFSTCSFSPAKQSKNGTLWFLMITLVTLVLWRLHHRNLRHAIKLKSLMGVLVLITALGFSSSSYAINAQSFAPADAVGSGFGLFTSQTLEPGHMAAGVFLNYVHHPLELGQINNDPRVLGVVDRFITADVIATVGVFEHVNLTVNMPINLYHDIAPTLIPTRDQGGPDLGDVRISAKIQIVNADTSPMHLGLAFVPFVTAPTGDEDSFLGDDGVSGGFAVVGEKKFGPHRLYANIGAKFKKRETLGNLVVDDAMTFGVGYQHQFSETHAISGIAEVQGLTTTRKFFNDEISSPVEARVILKKDFLKERNLHTYIGAGAGFTNGYGAPDFRIYSGVTFDFDFMKKKEKVIQKIGKTKKKDVFVETVFFANDKDQFYPENWAQVKSAANFWKAHPNSWIVIVGHTDSNADDGYNQRLSDRRTQTVLRALVKMGVPKDKIKTSFFGEQKPTDNNDTPDGRQHNRRVEIQIIIGGR